MNPFYKRPASVSATSLLYNGHFFPTLCPRPSTSCALQSEHCRLEHPATAYRLARADRLIGSSLVGRQRFLAFFFDNGARIAVTERAGTALDPLLDIKWLNVAIVRL